MTPRVEETFSFGKQDNYISNKFVVVKLQKMNLYILIIVLIIIIFIEH